MTDSPDADAGNVTDVPDGDDDAATGTPAGEDDDDAAPAGRSEATDEFWQEVGVEPIKITLPRDQVGYTLRAYRPASQLAPTEAAPVDEDEDDPFAARERARAAEDAELATDEAELAELTDEAQLTDDEPAPEDFADEQDQEDQEDLDEEDVPVFLSHRGRLLLFATPESLVSFVGSEASHDLVQLDTWAALAKRVRPDDIVATDEDTYRLDRVVENLRAAHQAWDVPLLVSAGELARDLGYALRLEPIVTALAPGSPLDDLDDALRAVAAGGVTGMFARRRLRRIGAQQASLGWRTIIGKITAAVDWRD